MCKLYLKVERTIRYKMWKCESTYGGNILTIHGSTSITQSQYSKKRDEQAKDFGAAQA